MATLRLSKDFFVKNKINKIQIEGQPNGTENVEIETNAFVGNDGPFPQIDIVNCHTVVLRKNAFHGKFLGNLT